MDVRIEFSVKNYTGKDTKQENTLQYNFCMSNITDCIPDTSLAGIVYNLWIVLMISVCLLFNICTAFACIQQAKHINSAAFYVLANLVAHLLDLCSSNTFAAFDYQFRNTWLAIGLAWLIGIHRQLQRMFRGEQLEHCLAPGFVEYQSSSKDVDELAIIQFLDNELLAGLTIPTFFDILALAKLGMERLPFLPFYHPQHCHNERVRTFMVCLTTSAYHVAFVLVLGPLITSRDLFHVLNLIATVLPALLILLFSPGYRKQFKTLYFRCCLCCIRDDTKKIHGMAKQVQVYPSTNVKRMHVNVGMAPIQQIPRN